MPAPRRSHAALSAMQIALVTLGLFAIPVAAQAHAILESSTPALGGSIAAGPATIDLRYNSRIDQHRSLFTLTGPDGKTVTLTVAPGTPVDQLRAKVTLVPGAYVAHWLVLAVDGHITRGDVPFTATAK
ncbi:MAG: copper resistance protein CopC [Rhodospirillales bacterium]|nr:copper resistance protein CopC [Rhodospirillales bacterium]